jgi:endopolyphosphatase
MTFGTRGKERIPCRQLPKNMSMEYMPYEMEDLTIGSWIRIAQRIGDWNDDKIRKKFKKFMYFGLF